jgi:S1-C subfamily serine protease
MSRLIELSDELEALVAKVSPAVVGVEQGRGHGTGVVLAQDGYLLTNDHVAGDGQRLQVRLADGHRRRGELVGSDSQTDLAVIHVEEGRLPTLPLAESRPLAVGQLVVAIGNPFRFERSVSVGIISALDRSLPGPKGFPFEGLVQTDAAINPGNSGGPLVSARGEVVGINTAAIPSAQGMGFAVNAKTATWVAAVLIQKGEVKRRYLGVAARATALPSDFADAAGQRQAVQVLEVQDGSPAKAAGVMSEDYLLSVHGRPIANVDDVHRLIVLQGADEVELEVFRRGERKKLLARPLEQKRRAA